MLISSKSKLKSGSSILFLLSKEDCEKLPVKILFNELNTLIARKDFTGKKGSLIKIPLFENQQFQNIFLAGLGEKNNLNSNLLRDTLAYAFRTIGRNHVNSVYVPTEHINCENLNFILSEAAELSAYNFDKYKSKNNDYEPFSLNEIFIDDNFSEDEIITGKKFAQAQIFSRDLANEPGCIINPQSLSEKALDLANRYNLICDVWDENKLKSENMGALLAVGSGSVNPPRLIHLTYKPKNPVKKIALVGKGITFDSGGLDIKPENYMSTMKCDKTGACDVLGIIKGAVELNLNVEIHGFLAAAENMPSGSSYRPDDIIKARNGKTIEIDNTDAEGRLVLADALSLASELNPDVIIDIATLTGACAVALGNWRAGLFVNNDKLSNDLLIASEKSGESLWRMPHEDPHIEETLKSNFADLTNCGKRYGGAIFAAIFLSNFVSDNISWAHLDIAGTDFHEKEYGIYSKGASAFGVRTCLHFIMNV